MASFSLAFSPRTISYTSSPITECASDLEVLNARILGRADDLGGSFDSAATQFTDLIAWDIKSLSEEDLQMWRDAAVAVTYAAAVAEMWAGHVSDFHSERAGQVSDWNTTRSEKENAVPGQYQDDVITASYPERGGMWVTGWGAGDENKCRDLYDELNSTLSSLNERENTNWTTFQNHAAEIKEMLEQGPTKANVQKLINAGNADWTFYNIDPGRYTMLVDGSDLTADNAEDWADELSAYWSGDKPIDERYHELMLMMAMVGTNAKQAQQNGTDFRPEEMAFLEAFYDRLESENTTEDGYGLGLLAIPADMAESDMTDEEREHALGVLGDGLLALSDPRLGGGYDSLPQSIRYAVEGPYLNQHDDKLVSAPAVYWEDLSSLSALFAHTDEGLEGGYGLSTNMQLSMGNFLDGWGDEHDPEGVLPSSQEMAALIDVGTRNKDSNYFMLTGEHMDPEPGIEYEDDLRTSALEGMFTYEWHDGGETARQLTDWLAEDIHSADEQEATRAGDGFAGFMETMTDADLHEALVNTGVDVTEGDNEYSNASFTQFNGGLADSLADVFDSHIYSFANGDIYDVDNNPIEGIGEYDHDTGLVQMGPQERAMYMQFLMGNDESAGRVVNSVDVYQQIESVAYLESGDAPSSARGAGQLQALLEQSLEMESQDRSDDLDEQIERETQITEFVVGEAGNLSEKIPVIGVAVSKGMELGQDSIVQAIIDGEYEVSPRFPTYSTDENIERTFSLEAFDFVNQNTPDELNNVSDPDDLSTLVEGGALTIERDGQAISAEDIDEGFVFDDSVTVSLEKNPSEWSANTMSELDSMDSALRNVLKNVDVTADGETATGDSYVREFAEDYTSAYDTTRDYFN
ncbi:TPR repeat region-containing protein [Nocardiopsis aegyptia]|uniref:TPR repeat domain-containing protein n=1 Tax=Nocardiopsis aegyptia TaxID=220378 RepID=A0A7Z0EPA2_9ACTN|nr:hypothetical protein [Nocardiopsis aegyptia]NYJ35559.1 hypothetical protein [Nocardiopsis aegyptia]